jgi:hypothetical protein
MDKRIVSAETDSNLVSWFEAKHFAEQITPAVFRGGENKTVTRTIASSITLNDKDSIPALYIFNYGNDEGYVIMSADFRYEPICAFVESGNISSGDTVAPAFDNWIGYTIENIELIRDREYVDNDNTGKISWVTLGGKIHLEYESPRYSTYKRDFALWPCEPWQYANKEPLMSTAWDQGCTFNDSIPENGDDCYRSPTGCVATAAAQVMRYWADNNGGFTYNYAQMPDNAGNSEVQRLMFKIGDLIGIDWKPAGSAGNTADLRHMFQYYYLYANPGTYEDYGHNERYVVKANLDAGKPVIMDGCHSRTRRFFFYKYGDCHTWVCDGYQYAVSGCMAGRFHFNMNWGWGGDGNGFFYQTDWTISTSSFTRNFQYANSFLHNINP